MSKYLQTTNMNCSFSEFHIDIIFLIIKVSDVISCFTLVLHFSNGPRPLVALEFMIQTKLKQCDTPFSKPFLASKVWGEMYKKCKVHILGTIFVSKSNGDYWIKH